MRCVRLREHLQYLSIDCRTPLVLGGKEFLDPSVAVLKEPVRIAFYNVHDDTPSMLRQLINLGVQVVYKVRQLDHRCVLKANATALMIQCVG